VVGRSSVVEPDVLETSARLGEDREKSFGRETTPVVNGG
jgi:hypothetical protein